MKDGPGVCERERECVSLCVYHGVIAIMEAGQNVCESVYMYHVCVCVSWCHSHYGGWTKCV